MWTLWLIVFGGDLGCPRVPYVSKGAGRDLSLRCCAVLMKAATASGLWRRRRELCTGATSPGTLLESPTRSTESSSPSSRIPANRQANAKQPERNAKQSKAKVRSAVRYRRTGTKRMKYPMGRGFSRQHHGTAHAPIGNRDLTHRQVSPHECQQAAPSLCCARISWTARSVWQRSGR